MSEAKHIIEVAFRQAMPFSSLSAQSRGELVNGCSLVKYGAKEIILGDGELVSCGYVLASGHIMRYAIGPDGNRIVFNDTLPCKAFAFATIFNETRHIGIIEAVENSEVVRVPAPLVIDLFGRDKDFARSVAKYLAKSSINQTIARMESLFPVPVRVAREICYQMDKNGVAQIDSKSNLAKKLEIRPETLSRSLAKMRESGMIEVEGSTIRVLDIPALKSFACQ